MPPALVLCINPSINMIVFFRIRGAYLRWASARLGQAVIDVAPMPAFFIAMAAKSIAALRSATPLPFHPQLELGTLNLCSSDDDQIYPSF